MEIIPFSRRLLKRGWRKRSGYDKLSQSSKRNVKIVRFGTSSVNEAASKRTRPWRLRLAPKLRLASSPVRIWCRLKNAYMKMALRISNGSGTSKARGAPMAKSRAEFENRLILEIYKSMVSSLELGYHPHK